MLKGKKSIVGFLVTVVWLAGIPTVSAEGLGKTIFEQRCSACHTVGKGKLVGPDLKGITAKRERPWLVRWISEPDKMIAEGDPIAVGLLKEFNNVPMPNMGLSPAEAESVISYLERSLQGSSTPKTSDPALESTRDEIELGRNLFQGKIRFANSGPSSPPIRENTVVNSLARMPPPITASFFT